MNSFPFGVNEYSTRGGTSGNTLRSIKPSASSSRSCFVSEPCENELVYANVIDIDSRVQAMFAQFHHSRKKSDVFFRISHAPRIGEKDYDKSSLYVYPSGKYKHMSLREDDTFVTGLVVSEKVLERQKDGYIIFAWDLI